MYLTVKNVGKGRSFETQANLRNLSGDGLLLHDGRFRHLEHDAGRREARRVHVRRATELADPEAKVELSIVDQDLRESVVEKVRIPIADPPAIDHAEVAAR